MAKHITKWLSFLLCIMIFTGCSSVKTGNQIDISAKSSDSLYGEDETTLYNDKVAMDKPVRQLGGEITYHEGYIYYPERDNTGHYIFKRLNLTTGEVSSPCIDPLCSHDTTDCPFYCGTVSPAQLRFFDDWIMIQAEFEDAVYDQTTHSILVESHYKNLIYNFNTGEWREIFKSNKNATSNSVQVVQIENYLYKTSYGSRRTVNGVSYIPSEIRRYNLKTGEETTVYSHDYYICLSMSGENRIYFYEMLDETYKYYSVDKNGEDFREETTWEIHPSYVYQNKIYGPDKNGNVDVTLYMNDLNTGEIVKIADDYIRAGLYVSENAIYYISKDYYAQYWKDLPALMAEAKAAGVSMSEEPYKSREEEMLLKYLTSSAYLWRCDLNGENAEMVMELPGAGLLSVYVWDEYLYTAYEFYDLQTGEQLGSEDEKGALCRIHLDTGKVEFLHELGK